MGEVLYQSLLKGFLPARPDPTERADVFGDGVRASVVYKWCLDPSGKIIIIIHWSLFPGEIKIERD